MIKISESKNTDYEYNEIFEKDLFILDGLGINTLDSFIYLILNKCLNKEDELWTAERQLNIKFKIHLITGLIFCQLKGN